MAAPLHPIDRTTTPLPPLAAHESRVSSDPAPSSPLDNPNHSSDGDTLAGDLEKGLGGSKESTRDLEKGDSALMTSPTHDEELEEALSAPGGEDPFFVGIKGREKLHPHTWGVNYRWAETAFAGLLVLNATFASSAPSNLIPAIIDYFGTSQESPLLWGPLSERYGRKNIFIVSFLPYTAFQLGAALAPNVNALIVFRFLGGVFASAPLSVSGGVIADLWDADRRGDAMSIFALMPFMGPSIAPIISGYMAVTGTDWRWIFWVLTIFAGVCWLAIFPILPETYLPYILYKEAARLRKETGDSRWHSALHDEAEKGKTVMDHLNRTVFKPFVMIVQEPMLLAITVYMSFVYGIIYLLFELVPLVFVGEHGLNSGESGLVFLALTGGGVAAVLLYIFYYNPVYVELHKLGPVAPEHRLNPMMLAAPIFAFCFFWIGFTSYPSISIASPILGIFVLGATVLLIFLACFNFLIDTYLAQAASALAINTVVRSSFGAGFPLFANQMFAKLGIPGGAGLLGGLAICFIPIPFLLIKYGKQIRGMSKHAAKVQH